MTITKAVIGALLASLLGAPNLAAQRANAPAAESFVIETPAYRVAVSHVPVVIDPTPGNMPWLVVRVYLPDSVMQQLRLAPRTDPGQPRSSAGQHYRGANYDVLIKPEAYVERVNMAPSIITLSQPTPVRR